MRSLLLVILLLLGGSAMAAEVTLYVSPGGNDDWSGRLRFRTAGLTDGPLATPAKARDTARLLLAAGETVTIELAGGTYELAEPLVMDERDSGMTWRSRPGERAVFSGGSLVAGWEPAGEGFPEGVMRAKVESGKRFHQLWVDGARRQCARLPDEGYLRVPQLREKGFYYQETDLEDLSHLTEDGLLFMLHLWESSYHWVDSLDAEAKYVELSTPDIPWGGHYPPWEAHRRYWIEGVREGLTKPGQWWLDAREGWLYYWPLAGEDMTKAEVVVPRLAPTLLVVEGKPEEGRFVEDLRFEGLTFAYTDTELPREGKGVSQAAVAQRAAVMVTGATECAFLDCEIAHIGEHGLWLRRGSQDCRLERCHVHDLGAGGLRIGEPETAPDEAQAVERITVENCYVHDGALLFAGGPGILIGRSSYNTIRHSEVSDFLHIGISVGWQWGYQPTTAHDNVIEFNRVHHIGHGMLSDMGAIYTLGESPGSVLRGNVVHDVLAYPKYYNGHLAKGLGDAPTEGSGIYNDEGAVGYLVEGNVVYNVSGAAYFINYGHTNELRGNLFGLSPVAVWINHAQDFASMFDLAGNVLAPTSQFAFVENAWSKLDASDNLWVVPPDVTPLFDGKPFSDWQGQRRDMDGKVVAQALPQDSEQAVRQLLALGGARLKLASQAFETAGLYGPVEWTSLPGKYPPRADAPPAPSRQPEFFLEDFERVSLGRTPMRALLAVPEGTGLAVTNEQRFSGTQSLKVTDGPVEPGFAPHWYYEPAVYSGKVRLAFDLLLPAEGACALNIEARDWSQTAYHTGVRLDIEADGALKASGQTLGQLPLGDWIHLTVVFAVGSDKGASFEVTARLADGQEFHGSFPYGDPAFERLTWLGFTAPVEVAGSCYLDNLELAEE